MPDPYIDSSLQTGFNDTSLLSLKLDTTQRFQKVLADNVNPTLPPPPAQISTEDRQVNDILSGKYTSIDLNQAAISDNAKLRDAANYMIDKKMSADPVAQGVGATKFSIYDKSMDKFLEGRFGFNPQGDEEDFYYRNEYMSDNALWRNTKNVGRFIGRVIPQALMKFGEGIGYAGTMLTSIGSTNYWADVADNALSRTLEQAEESWKNTGFLKVYRQAGFDEKGFFSKLTDWTFWNESVADGVAFMASAFIPGGILSKLGKIGAVAAEGAEAFNWFGKAFSTTNALGKAASAVGLGSGAELATWTLNTAMEAAQEGAGVFKEVTKRLKEARARGENDMSDEAIRQQAGKLAGNTVLENFAVLGLSNAWENKLFFKALGKGEGSKAALTLGEDFKVGNAAYERLAKKGIQITNPLSRAGFYGRKALEGVVMEGLWEENAQLAIQRMNQGDSEYGGFLGFWQQMGKQTYDASWWGKGDQEAAESIGLGALIGIGGGTVFSKIGRERRNQIDAIKAGIRDGDKAYQRLFNINDIYERDSNNRIQFDDNNEPKIDAQKQAMRNAAIQITAAKLGAMDMSSLPGNFMAKRAFANYVRSLNAIGVENISKRFSNLTPETAALFGIDPATPNKDAAQFADLADTFEQHSRNTEKIKNGNKPEELSQKDFLEENRLRKSKIYKALTDNTILSSMHADETSKLLALIAQTRNISNSSIADSVVDNLNMINQQRLKNEKFIESAAFKDLSEPEKEYHIQRNKDLIAETEKIKEANAIVLEKAVVSEKGFWNAIVDDKMVHPPKEMGEISSRIADYNNIMHKNTYMSNLFSESYDEYAKWYPRIKEEEEQEATTNVSGKKYKEINKGDFAKVAPLVAKMVFGENQTYSPEELQLQQNYRDLIEELLPQYEQAVENQRIKVLVSKADTLKQSAKLLAELIRTQTESADDAQTELEILIDDLNNIDNQGKARQKEIAQAINALEEKLEKFEEWIGPQTLKLQDINSEVELIEQEIQGGSFKGLVGALEELKKERDWLGKEIQSTTSLIDRLSKLLSQIRRLAYKIFGTKSDFARNLEKGRHEAVNYATEIERTAQDLAEAKQLAKRLDEVKNELEAKYKSNQNFIDSILNEVDASFKKKYIDLTQAKPEPIDVEDEAIAKNYTADQEAFPVGENNDSSVPDDEDGFDGNAYQRPLSTKFFTATFPYIVRGEPTEKEQKLLDAGLAFFWDKVPQSTKDYFDFVDYLTDEANTKDIKTKIANGSLKSLIVTRNNVEKLGLSKLLDKAQWFDITEPDKTHMEIIPVLEFPEGLFYVDSKLNKLGKVGETPNPKIIRSSLRTVKFTEDEESQYIKMYSGSANPTPGQIDDARAQMNKAMKVATDWRKTMLNTTAKESTKRYDFNITRGIPNRMIMQDNTQAKNPVVGHLISEIQPDSVVVFSDKTNSVTINGEQITLPVGRPFIKSSNGLPFAKGGHIQYHAANNSQLNSDQVETILTVLEEMMKDHISKVMDKVNNDEDFKKWKNVIEKEGGIQNLDRTQKRKLFLDVTKASNKKGFGLFNTNYTIYLSSILHFGNVQKNKSAGVNQLHFVGPKLVFGNSGIAIDMVTREGLRESEVRAFLNGQYHNIKYFTKAEVQKREFIEFYLEKGKLETREWDNYAQYLLSEKNPDESPRLSIPVTTAIKNKSQYKVEDTAEPYYRYKSRGITLLTESQTKIPKKSKSKMAQAMAEAQKKIAEVQGTPIPEEVETEEPVIPDVPSTGNKMADAMNAAKAMIAQVQAQQNKAAQTPPAPEAPKAPAAAPEVPSAQATEVEGEDIELNFEEPWMSLPGEEPDSNEPIIGDNLNYRFAEGGVFKKEEDLDAVIEKVHKMLPQFPIQRLRNIIKTLDGREAWGQFVDNVIKVYEGAEEGTLYHEAFEAVANRILNNKEWGAIEKEFKNRRGYFTDRATGSRIKFSDASPYQAKEALAEEFRSYMLTGKLPAFESQPQTKSYFKILWDFIKSLFTSKTTINDVFKSIESGKFANSEVRGADRFSDNYSIRMPGIPVQIVRELFEGATAEMFRHVFRRPDSLSSLDNIDETDESLYEPIRVSFVNKMAALEEALAETGDEKLKDKYRQAIKNISIATEKWPAFVKAHKDELKRFRIKFEEEEGTEESEDLKNRNDYLQEHFKTDGKNNASKSVKFLFGTLLKLRGDRTGGVVDIEGKMVAKTEAIQSTTYLNSLAGYDEYMFKALDEFKGMNDWSRIQTRLEELSGIRKMEDLAKDKREEVLRNNPSATEEQIMKEVHKTLGDTVKTLSREEATWTSLYTRMFGVYPEINSDAQWMLKVKVHNYVSKFAPTSWLMIDGGGASYLLDAVKRPYFEKTRRQITQGIIKTYNKFFEKDKKEGAYVARSAYKETTTFDEFTERTAKQMAREAVPEKVEEIIKLLNLEKELSQEFLMKTLNIDERNKMFNNLLTIRNAIPYAKIYGKSFTPRTLDIDGYIKNLINNLDRYFNLAEKTSQIQGINNEMRQIYVNPSLMSRLFSEIENVSTLNELYRKFPHMAKTFSKDSIILERLFDKNGDKRTNYKITLDYLAGLKNSDANLGKSTSQLEQHDRYFQQFNASLSGLYLSLPADSETDWAFNFGEEFVTYSENILGNRGKRIIEKMFLPKLKTEIDLIITNDSRLAQFAEKYSNNTKDKGANSNVGSSLRFFKNMIVDKKGNPDTKLLDTIYNEIDNGKSAEAIVTLYNKQIVEGIKNYLAKEVNQAKNAMLDSNLAISVGEGYMMRGLNFDFTEKYQGSFTSTEGATFMTESVFKSLLEYQKINSTLASMEMFKIAYGDPAQYKDWEKRAKSMFSPYEQTFYDETGRFNTYLNTEKNKVTFEGETFDLPVGDMFNTIFGDVINSRTINDLSVVDAQTVNDLRGIGGEFIMKFIKEYEKSNEVDGQSIGTLEFARQLMIKSGWRWTPAMEAYYQYDNALMRRHLAGTGEYRYNDSLRAIDNKLIEYYENDEAGIELLSQAKLTPLKTIMPTFDENGDHILDKHSIHFMSFQVAKEFELFDLYKNMLKNGEQLLNFKSAQKVGTKLDNEGKITDYYSSPFTKTDLKKVGNPVQTIDLRHLGIQVETQSSEWGQTLGSQLTKLVNLALSEQGIPNDFMNDGTLTLSERIEEWEKLSEQEKINVSEKYAKVIEARDNLSNLKLKNTIEKFTSLGIRWKYDALKGFTYEVNDLTKIKDFIMNELRRLDVDSNTIDNIELTENRKAFENTAETTPSYETISNLLWSMADKAVTSMKVNGKPLVQVSSVFFNKGSREAAYQDDKGNWIKLETKEAYDKFVAENDKLPKDKKKKVMMTSSELKFYSLGDDKINAMEVYLPHIYLDKVNKRRKERGMKALNDLELMDWLNKPENQKLLEGIGFRIPTQATSSIEFFVIKGFLPKAFGSAVVVPSAITTKAGSDFDVDKLNTYLNNWKFNKEGLPVYEEFDTDTSERARMKRFIQFINDNSPKDEKNYVKALARSNKEEVIEAFRKIGDEIAKEIAEKKSSFLQQNYATFLETLKSIKNIGKNELDSVISELFATGKGLFKRLSPELKDTFFDLRDILEARDVNGPNEIFEYLLLAERLVQGARGTDKNLLSQMIVIYNLELDAFQKNRDERQKYINSAKERLGTDNKSVRDYYKQLKTSTFENEDFGSQIEEGLFNMNFDIAREISKLTDGITFEEFSALPLTLQNTKGAVENQYFQSIRNILSSKDMFAQLLSPNSADNIKDMRDEVFKAKDPTYDPKKQDKKEIDYSRATSTEWIAEKRNQFVKGKKDIGIGAVAMTNYANASVVGLGIAIQGKVKDRGDRKIIYDLNDGKIDLPFSDIEMLKVDGKYIISISKLRDKNGNLTMDKLSGYINGFVDVAKDPFIAEMGMHSEFAGVYLLLERMGLTGKTIALFMYQPIIRDYLKEVLLLDNKSFYGYKNYDTRGKIQEGFVKEYQPEGFEYDTDFKFTDENLIKLIQKGEAIKRGEAKDFTREEKRDQYMAFITFLKLKVYSNNLLENIQAANHDTSSIRNSETLMMKDLKLERAKLGNLVVKLSDGKVINGGQALRDNTSVAMDISMMQNFENLFTDIGLFSLQRTNPRQALYKIGKRVYFEDPYLTQDEFVNIMRDYKSSIIDLLVNDTDIPVLNNGNWENVKMYRYYKNFFETGMKDSKGNPTTIKAFFDRLKKSYPNTFQGNFFLSKLEVITDKVLGIDLIQLDKAVMRNDVLTKEKLIEALIQLSNYHPDNYTSNFKQFASDMNQLYRMILYGGYMQNGIRFSMFSYINLLPVKSRNPNDPTTDGEASLAITDLTKYGLSKIDDYDFTYLDEQIQRTKWYRAGVVREEMFNAVNMIVPSSTKEGKFVLDTKAKWKGGKKAKKGEKIPRKKTNQTFFGRVEEFEVDGKIEERIVPQITPIMIWAGYEGEENDWESSPNIIKVPAIHPDYLRLVRKFNEEQGREISYWDVQTRVYDMIKAGDHSYLFYQLFQKVGVYDRSLARKYISKGKNNKKSVNYMYKPINKQGDAKFNEFKPLLFDVDNNPYMTKSIIDAPPFRELSDIEIISNIVDSDGLIPVFEPEIPTDVKPISVPKPGQKLPKKTQLTSINMDAKNAGRVVIGKKTTTVRTEKQARDINIPVGATEIRLISGDPYNITNRGYLTLQEAGGLKSILESEGLTMEEAVNYPSTKAWIEDKGRMYVYDIKPADPIDPGDKPPIEPEC